MQSVKKIIKIVKGYEQNVRVSNDICNKTHFMYPAYQQAMRALMEIVRQTRNFHARDCQNSNDDRRSVALFRYSGNIIAFEGERGRGKTQTMLSFANTIGKTCAPCDAHDCKAHIDFLGAEDQKLLADLHFHIMSPIAPSVLEAKQNLLYVILSRLYDFADDILRNDRHENAIAERDRRELSRLFSDCLSGINGIKQTNDVTLELAALQGISDGVALRQHFYDLIQQLIRMHNPKHSVRDSYIVIQLDDADSQIKNGYKALEDIRKYLVIPNLVILMSADINFLHRVILQEHLVQFRGQDLEEDLSGTSRKYIDKLIPPSHMIHLPKVEKIVEMGRDDLQLRYVIDVDCGCKDRERSVLEWMIDERGREIPWDLQSAFLMLIYRKTGVIFAPPAHSLHSIIPRTLRGLNQLLYFLSQMEDIPLLNKDAFSDSRALALKIQEQLEIEEPNLTAFTTYFSSDWMEAKFHNEQVRDFLREFSRASCYHQIPLTLDFLEEYYGDLPLRYDLEDELDDTPGITLDRQAQIALYTYLQGLDFGNTSKSYKFYLSKLKEVLRYDENRTTAVFDADTCQSSLSLLNVLENYSIIDSAHAAIEEIRKLLTPKVPNSSPKTKNNKRERASRIALDELLYRLEDTYNKQEDLLLFFTIRTLLSLESHHLVLQQKKRTVERYLVNLPEDSHDASKVPLLAFDFDPDVTYLPRTYWLDEEIRQIPINFSPLGSDLLPTEERRTAVTRETAYLKDTWTMNLSITDDYPQEILYDCMISPDEKGRNSLNFMNFITLLLRIGFDRKRLSKTMGESLGSPIADRTIEPYLQKTGWSPRQYLQYRLYEMQESALLIAANWEVPARINDYLKREIDKAMPKLMLDRYADASQILRLLYGCVDSALQIAFGEQLYKHIVEPQVLSDGEDSGDDGRIESAFAFNMYVGRIFSIDFGVYFIQKLFGGA